MTGEGQESSVSAEQATQGTEAAQVRSLWWAEASIWTDRMASALGNGVKGGRTPSSRTLGCHPDNSSGHREMLSKKEPVTGEPYAGKPHVRFGGRGGASLPYPYQASRLS